MKNRKLAGYLQFEQNLFTNDDKGNNKSYDEVLKVKKFYTRNHNLKV